MSPTTNGVHNRIATADPAPPPAKLVTPGEVAAHVEGLQRVLFASIRADQVTAAIEALMSRAALGDAGAIKQMIALLGVQAGSTTVIANQFNVTPAAGPSSLALRRLACWFLAKNGASYSAAVARHLDLSTAEAAEAVMAGCEWFRQRGALWEVTPAGRREVG